MTKICFNVRGSNGGGGPSVFVYKTAIELQKRGHAVMYSNPQNSDAAICIIETGKVRRQCADSDTKIIVRIDGIYNDEYNKKFNRAIRPDMIALHNKLKEDIPAVHHVVYQSNWSKARIDEEIVRRQDNNWSVIHNGVDTNLFKPTKPAHQRQGQLKLAHVGLMRNGYIMESLVGTFEELRRRGRDVHLLLVGSMDNECQKVFAPYKNNPNITHKSPAANSSLPQLYGWADIYMGPRQGSSSDNVIAEAQACGLPVIVPSWGGNADMVIDKQTGIVVSTGHWDYTTEYNNKIADAVEEIAENLTEFKTQARKHAVAELTIGRMVDKYLNIIHGS